VWSAFVRSAAAVTVPPRRCSRRSGSVCRTRDARERDVHHAYY
jgi:hypothetical protein